MIVIDIKGGLGNQLYQFMAAYYAMKQRNKNEEIFAFTPFYNSQKKRTLKLEYFNIPYCIYEGDTSQLTLVPYVEFSDLTQIDFSSFGTHILLPDYYIHHSHISAYREEFVSLVQPRLDVLSPPQEYFNIQEQITSTNSVIVHIRHGDYLDPEFAMYGVLASSYYHTLITKIQKEMQDCHFFFFSDNTAFLEDEFSDIDNATIVQLDHSHADILEFELMRYGNSYIISNSTFSQLPALLYYSEKKPTVYAPHTYAKNIPNTDDSSKFLPKDWMYIENNDLFADEGEMKSYTRKYYFDTFYDKHKVLFEHNKSLSQEYAHLSQAYKYVPENRWYLFGKMSKTKKLLFIVKMLIKKLFFFK